VVEATGPTLTCRAPAVAMHFTITGEVHACCQNGHDEFGDVRTDTLAEIWEGVQRRSMAAALAAGDYPVGCEGCAIEHGLGNRASTPAPPFDRFPEGAPIWPRQLEFTLSNRCNLACIQCNGDNSSTIRLRREGRPPLPMPYGDRFFEELVPFLDHVEVCAFLGGEPFLTPQARRVWDLLIEQGRSPRVEVTTNATIWSSKVEGYLRALKMNLALSIDGATAATYESIREGARYDRVVEVRDAMLATAGEYGGEVHLNFCLLRANWHEVGHFLRQADALGVPANIIPVWAPDEHSLFTLDREALSPIVATLVEESAVVRRELDRNRPAWDTVLRVLTDQLDRLGSDRSRDATRAQLAADRRRADEEAKQRAEEARQRAAEEEARREMERHRHRVEQAVGSIEAELAEWGSGECIEVRTMGDRIEGVDVPTWAEPLDPSGWIGLDLDAISGALAQGLEPAVSSETETEFVDGLEGFVVIRASSTLPTPAGVVGFRAIHIPSVERMLIAATGPVDALADVAKGTVR
jgi:MoaA/NifB/PqqE/SkfB family radical SAM enzyme